MKTTTETVSPIQAAEWLKKNTRNRHLAATKVQRFMRDIVSGAWSLTHQSLGIAPSFVVDGQHRLEAIKESGVAVEMNVTRYATDAEGEAAIMSVDLADKRSTGDLLEISGTLPRGSGKAIVSCVRTLLGLGLGGAGGKAPTASETRAYYLKEQTHLDWAMRTFVDPKGSKRRFTSVHRCAFIIAHMLDAPRAEEFAGQVVATIAPEGSCSQAWLRAEAEGRLSGAGRAKTAASIYLGLRLIQAAFSEEPAPRSFKASISSLSWFRNQVEKKRDLEAKNASQMGAVLQ